jgi:hypothetical protein
MLSKNYFRIPPPLPEKLVAYHPLLKGGQGSFSRPLDVLKNISVMETYCKNVKGGAGNLQPPPLTGIDDCLF